MNILNVLGRVLYFIVLLLLIYTFCANERYFYLLDKSSLFGIPYCVLYGILSVVSLYQLIFNNMIGWIIACIEYVLVILFFLNNLIEMFYDEGITSISILIAFCVLSFWGLFSILLLKIKPRDRNNDNAENNAH